MMNWNGFGRKRSKLKHGIIPALVELRKTMMNIVHAIFKVKIRKKYVA
jgi:hypothetical protein